MLATELAINVKNKNTLKYGYLLGFLLSPKCIISRPFKQQKAEK